MNRIIAVFIVVVFFAACNTVDKRQQKIDKINAAEKVLMEQDSLTVNTKEADKLVILYSEFVKQYPGDSLSANMLFKEAEILVSIGKSKEAVNVIDSLISGYPDFNLLPEAMHFKGFIYDDKLHSPEMARLSFKALIERFPGHELSKNAEAYMKILGKSPEEVVKEFEERNNEAE